MRNILRVHPFYPTIAHVLYHCPPVKSSHGLFKKVQPASASDIQIMTGAVSAIMRKRASLPAALPRFVDVPG